METLIKDCCVICHVIEVHFGVSSYGLDVPISFVSTGEHFGTRMVFIALDAIVVSELKQDVLTDRGNLRLFHADIVEILKCK